MGTSAAPSATIVGGDPASVGRLSSTSPAVRRGQQPGADQDRRARATFSTTSTFRTRLPGFAPR